MNNMITQFEEQIKNMFNENDKNMNKIDTYLNENLLERVLSLETSTTHTELNTRLEQLEQKPC